MLKSDFTQYGRFCNPLAEAAFWRIDSQYTLCGKDLHKPLLLEWL